jgi:hypothetical protein
MCAGQRLTHRKRLSQTRTAYSLSAELSEHLLLSHGISNLDRLKLISTGRVVAGYSRDDLTAS